MKLQGWRPTTSKVVGGDEDNKRGKARERRANALNVQQQAFERAVDLLIEGQKHAAACNPKYLEATARVIHEALLTPEVEARVWYDSLGELSLCRESLDEFLYEYTKDTSMPRVTERKVDEARLTVTWELSNGSAIVAGLKRYEHLTTGGEGPCR